MTKLCFKQSLFIIGLIHLLAVTAHGQKKDLNDSIYNNRRSIAEKNAEGLGSVLGLSKKQQQQMIKLDIEYFERINNLRSIRTASRDVSIAVKEVHQWRYDQLQSILTPPQWAAYIARQEKIESKGKGKLPPAKGKPVTLKRK